MNLSTATSIDLPFQQPLPQADAGRVQSLLVFYLGERAYALSIEFVVQIIPMLKLTPVPQAEQVIEGVANIHGKVVPVLSARRRLGLPLVAPRLYTPIILIQIAERMMGLIVDEVADVIHMPASQVVAPESILPEGCENSTVLSGVVYQKDQAILVLNPRFLLHPAQVRAVNKALQFMPVPEPQEMPGGNGSSPDPSVSLSEPVPEAQASGNPDPAAQPAMDPETAAVPENGAVPQNGHGKPRRKRRKLEATLAGEIASLAIDLPPSDGAQSSEGGCGALPDDGPVPSNPQESQGE